MPVALAELELVLPAWELDMNRHMVTHLAEAVRRHGPCWGWSMFGFERLWGRLTKWMTQTSHPEATMVNAWKAFITCCVARPERATELHSTSDEEPHAGLEAIPFHYRPTTFDRQTYKLQLPAFMYNTAGTPITLSDFYGEKCFGRGQHKDRYNRRAEFHLLYCKFPGLCKAFDCSSTALCTCLDYRELWDKFLHDTCRSVPSNAQLPVALDAWKVWGQHAGLSVQQQELCLGPELSVHVFDRATVGNARLACTRVEKSRFACDSVVLTKSNGKYWAGRVNAFLSHAPPGWEDCHLPEEANVAEVDCSADEPQLQASAVDCLSAWAAQWSSVTFEMTLLAISGQWRG